MHIAEQSEGSTVYTSCGQVVHSSRATHQTKEATCRHCVDIWNRDMNHVKS